MGTLQSVATGTVRSAGRSRGLSGVTPEAVVLASIVGLAGILRFMLLSHNSVWYDEAFVVWVARHRWGDLLGLLQATEFHPPLHYLMMKAWIAAAGPREAVIRVPSACFGLLTVVLTYALLRRLWSEPIAFTGSFLVAISPFEVMASQDGKMYALLGTLVVASTLALLEAVERGGVRPWIVYAAVAALLPYTHYLGFTVLAAHGAWVAACERRRLLAWCAAAIVVAVLFVPWLPYWAGQLTHLRSAPVWGRDSMDRNVLGLLGLFAFGGSLFHMPGFFFSNSPLSDLGMVAILLPFLIVLGVGVYVGAPERRAISLVGLLLVIPVGGMILLNLAKPTFIPRWFSFLDPFFAAVLARGIVGIPGGVRREARASVAAFAITGLLVLPSLPVLNHYYYDPDFHPYQWRQAATIVRERTLPGDLLLYGHLQNRLAFTYYFTAPNAEMEVLPDRDYATLGRLAGRFTRVWLIVAPPFDDGTLREVLSALRGSYRLVAQRQIRQDRFSGAEIFPFVYLFEAARPH